MASIHFTFGEGVASEERERVLQEIRSWSGIKTASQLKPESRHPVTMRLAYATVDVDGDAAALVERINKFASIDSASVPGRRRVAK